jgi:uncharacterized lipoprotein YajG
MSPVVGGVMRTLGLIFAIFVLAGCSSSASHTVVVEGEPEAVARFVEAEQARAGDVSVRHRSGDRRAEFSLSNTDEQSEMAQRAIGAKLAAVETRSMSWSVGGADYSAEQSSHSYPPPGETPSA